MAIVGRHGLPVAVHVAIASEGEQPRRATAPGFVRASPSRQGGWTRVEVFTLIPGPPGTLPSGTMRA
jgi:hypothetical protein